MAANNDPRGREPEPSLKVPKLPAGFLQLGLDLASPSELEATAPVPELAARLEGVITHPGDPNRPVDWWNLCATNTPTATTQNRLSSDAILTSVHYWDQRRKDLEAGMARALTSYIGHSRNPAGTLHTLAAQLGLTPAELTDIVTLAVPFPPGLWDRLEVLFPSERGKAAVAARSNDGD